MYVLKITRDKEEHVFPVPPGYDKHDPIIPQLNIYGRTLDTSAALIKPEEIRFLKGAMESYSNPYVAYQAFSCLTDMFRLRSDMFSFTDVWDLIETAEDKDHGAFSALGITLAQSAIYSRAIKRTSPFLKHLFRYAAEGEGSEIKNLAIHSLNEVSRNAAGYIREYMFNRARTEIMRSVENPAPDAVVSREYYAITGYLGKRARYQEGVLNKKDQAEFDKILVGLTKAYDESKEKYPNVDNKNRTAYWTLRRELIGRYVEVKDADQLNRLLKIALNKNSFRQSTFMGEGVLMAGADFAVDGYEYLKSFIGKGITKDNAVAFRLLQYSFYQMPAKIRAEKKEDYFQFTVDTIPKLTDSDIADWLGWSGSRNAEKLGLKDVVLTEDQIKKIFDRMQKSLDEFGGEGSMVKIDRRRYHSRPAAYGAYQDMALFMREHADARYPGEETYEKILARWRAESVEEQKAREENQRFKREMKTGQAEPPPDLNI